MVRVPVGATVLASLLASGSAVDVRWSVAAGSSSGIWSDNGAPLALCALDALHVHARWHLPTVALMRVAASSEPVASSHSTLEDERVLSALELVTVDVDRAPPGLAVASSAPAERSLRDLVDPERLAHAQQQREATRHNREQLLRCEFDAEFCVPQLVGIRLPDVLAPNQSLAANHSIVLEFAQPTNQPPATTGDAIGRFVRFTEYIGDELTGEWSADGRVLSIRVLALTPELLKPLDELMQGLLQTTLQLGEDSGGDADPDRQPQFFEEEDDGRHLTVLPTTDEISFRVEPLGVYRVRLAVSSKRGGDVVFAAESPLLRVLACGSPAVVLESSLLQAISEHQVPTQETEAHVRPSYSLSGVLSLAGQEGFVLPHSEIKMRELGSWTLSFWLLSAENPTGSFRTLFFNGDGAGAMRTPSAWWKPAESRLVLRVSTNVSADDGMDSEQFIPANEWVHMGFRFRNCSVSDGRRGGEANTSHGVSESEQCADARSAQRPWFYAISFFVNGAMDKEVFFTAPAIANSGPLHVGKGPWTDGMRGFVGNLRTFPVAITEAQLREEYIRERELHYNFPPRSSDATQVDEDDKDEVSNDGDAATTDAQSPRVQRREDERILGSRSRGWRTPPAVQISYLLQRYTHQAQSRHDSERDASLMLASVASLKSLQGSAYDAAIRLHRSCDSRAWDMMLEAAELGHSQALRDVGEAHLYGSFAFSEACATAGSSASASASLPVEQDLMRARDELEAAFKAGAWDAGKHLAVLFAAASPYPGVHDGTGLDRSSLSLANLALGLYHIAASAGRKDAFAILGRRYSEGDGVDAALDVGVYYFYHAAADASAAYHELGKQPLHEMNRLYDALKVDIAKGQRGDDDELIQFQKLRAEQGDVEAMAAMGDLYYWGARGMPRDHALAHEYFSRAARADHVAAQSAFAGMLLKGEGGPQDNASAIHWYEKAAARNHTRALNGLGFVHFYGTGGVSENKSLALEYFERAAANEEDGDSVFNAGYCHALGLGTASNLTRAIHYYDIAATKFGHFDAIFELGKIWMVGIDEGVADRSSERALKYLKAASDGGGRWGKCMREGFDRFLGGETRKAAVFFHEAKELGYPVATSNLAFLYDHQLLENGGESDGVGRLEREVRAFHFLLQTSMQNGDKEVLVRIGDYHFYGLAGLHPDAHEALRWYSRASAEGVDAGAYSVGHMHEYGVGVPVNLERARRYYERVIELAPESIEVYTVVRLALARLAIRKWVLEHAPTFAGYLAAPSIESSSVHGFARRGNSSNSTNGGARRRHFSELGGIALEDVWGASVYPVVVVVALALIGFVYVRRGSS